MALAEEILETIDRLLPANRTGVDGVALWDAVLRGNPALSVSADRRTRFVAALQELERRSEIRLPGSSPGNWDPSSAPAIPLRLNRIRERSEPDAPRALISWRPEMAFAAGMRGLRPPVIDELLKIQAFLAESEVFEPVPIKERSYQLFSDEKRLEAILSGEIGMHLSLGTLKIYSPRLVPVHHVVEGASTPSILVVENESAFDSFTRWNSSRRRFSMIVYGRGLEAPKYATFLVESAAAQQGPIIYFGDLDGHGVQIAYQTHLEILALGGRPLRPLAYAYEFLAREKPSSDFAEPSEAVWRVASTWLPISVREIATSLFTANKRVAQEAFGWNALSKLPADIIS